MSTVIGTVVTAKTDLPAGVIFGRVDLVLTEAAGVTQTATINPISKTAKFDLPAGTYTGIATAFDTNGTVIGTPTPASAPLTVVADTQFDAPVSVTLAMA
jgi:hypothetical protein